MAKTLSDLNSISALNDSDIILVRQGTVDRKTAPTEILNYIKEKSITFSNDISVEGTFSLGTNQKTAFNKDFGTTAGTVSEGNHTHNYQAPLNGSGFVKINGTTISYDNSTYSLSNHSHTDLYVSLTGSTMSGDLVVTKILPDMTGATGSISVRDIGDSTHRFANVWADEVHVGASSLYVNGKQVISDNSNIMTFATDPDQGVNLKTVSSVAGTGNGNLQLTSDNQIGVTAKGGIDMTVPSNVASKNLTLTNSSTNGSIILNAASQIQFTAPTVSTGNLTVTGDLVVNGTTTSIDTTNLLIEDNIVLLNKNQTGTPSTTLVSGLDVERGDQANYRFAFEELTDTFKIGMVGQLQPVATREDTPVSGGVATWDSTNNRFVTQAVTTAFNKSFGTTAGTISEGNHTHSYQPLDADLTSIAGLSGTTGLLKKTAADTWTLDTSAYLTGITKAQIEAQLTGTISTHIHSLFAPLAVSTNSSGTYSGQWTKFARVTIPVRYQDSQLNLTVIHKGSGSSFSYTNNLVIRVKQQNDFGSDPFIDVTNVYEKSSLGSVGYVIVQNTPTTIVDFYFKNNISYCEVDFFEKAILNSTYVTWYSNQIYEASVAGLVETSVVKSVTSADNITLGDTAITLGGTSSSISGLTSVQVEGDVRIDDSSGNAGFKMQYDNTSKSLKFIFVGA